MGEIVMPVTPEQQLSKTERRRAARQAKKLKVSVKPMYVEQTKAPCNEPLITRSSAHRKRLEKRLYVQHTYCLSIQVRWIKFRELADNTPVDAAIHKISNPHLTVYGSPLMSRVNTTSSYTTCLTQRPARGLWQSNEP